MNQIPAAMQNPTRILIVEDQPLLAKNLKQFLARSAEVRIAASGEQAIAMLEDFTPDALVMDYGLPGMNGLQTYSEIVRRCALPIDCIMITGDSTEELVQRARDKGVRGVLYKPFGFVALLELLTGTADCSRPAAAAR